MYLLDIYIYIYVCVPSLTQACFKCFKMFQASSFKIANEMACYGDGGQFHFNKSSLADATHIDIDQKTAEAFPELIPMTYAHSAPFSSILQLCCRYAPSPSE